MAAKTSPSQSTTSNSPWSALDKLKTVTAAASAPATDEIGAFEQALERKHPRSIAIVNYKGGVGKTTATFFIGSQLAHSEPKKRVLSGH